LILDYNTDITLKSSKSKEIVGGFFNLLSPKQVTGLETHKIKFKKLQMSIESTFEGFFTLSKYPALN